jgi:hypothetical protein
MAQLTARATGRSCSTEGARLENNNEESSLFEFPNEFILKPFFCRETLA